MPFERLQGEGRGRIRRIPKIDYTIDANPNPNSTPVPTPWNQNCPMFGVGENPLFVKRQQAVQKKKEARRKKKEMQSGDSAEL